MNAAAKPASSESRFGMHFGVRVGVRVGVDIGATLAKLAVQDGEKRVEFLSLPRAELDEVARRVQQHRPERIGLTGGGAAELARRLPREVAEVGEFEAWGSGARSLLGEANREDSRFVIVSLGTGTSFLHVDGDAVVRVGGTALGGGTILGLGAALLGTANFSEIAALAARGDRRQVDLLVSDIYREGEAPLPGAITAASFAKLARSPGETSSAPEDLAHAVMGLVGENVGLLCCATAERVQRQRIAFGGAALRNNPALEQILAGTCLALGRAPVFLPNGEFAGALGALQLAAA